MTLSTILKKSKNLIYILDYMCILIMQPCIYTHVSIKTLNSQLNLSITLIRMSKHVI